MELPQDSVGAFMTRDIRGGGAGPLGGLDWAAKDLFDLAGEVTGYGNPDWARTHAPAAATAPVVVALLDAGARLVGNEHRYLLDVLEIVEPVRFGNVLRTTQNIEYGSVQFCQILFRE